MLLLVQTPPMTSPFNSYEAPSAGSGELDPSTRLADLPPLLASREQRLVAAMIDALLAALVIGPLQYKFGLFAKFLAKQDFTAREIALWAVIGIAVWFAQHGYLLATQAQTIGKRIVGIRIEDVSGGRTPLAKLVFLRYLPTTCIANVPGLGGLVLIADILCIFRSDRRCLHDHLAGTRVVKVR